MDELDTFLEGQPTEAAPEPDVTPEPEPQPEPEAAAPEPAAEEPKGEEDGSTPEPESNAPMVPIAALQDERAKRQALEQQLQAAQSQDQPERPDVFQDPDGAFNHVEQQVTQQVTKVKLDLSESMVRSQHEDFDTKLDAFAEAMGKNPALHAEMMAHVNPAQFAYEQGTRELMLNDIGDPVAYEQSVRTKIEAEVRATVEAEMKAKQEADAKVRESIPESLVDARSTGPAGAGSVGPTPLGNIVGDA